jgi:hypothetical protein
MGSGGPGHFTEQDLRDQEEFKGGTRKMAVLGVAFGIAGILAILIFSSAFLSPGTNWESFFAGVLLAAPAIGIGSILLLMATRRFQVSQEWPTDT